MNLGGQADLNKLLSDWDAAHEKLEDETRKVLSKGSLNIKTAWKAAWRVRPKTPWLYTTIDYDLGKDLATGNQYGEIGPSPVPGGHSASLGGIIEEGTVNNAPHPGGAPALAAELPRFQDALAAMGQRLLEGD